jgi:hypothetical protein
MTPQLQIRFMHQRRRLQRVPRPLRRQPHTGNVPKLLVNLRRQIGRSTTAPRYRDIAWAISHRKLI